MWKRQLILFFLAAMPIWAWCQGQATQPGDTVRILLDASQSTLKSVFKFASRRYDLRVAYDPQALKKVSVNRRFDVRGRQAFVRQALKGTPFDYRMIGKTFVIVPRNKSSTEDSLAGQANAKNVTVNGNIVDVASGEPLSYANVSVVGTANQTASTPDGQFTLFDIPTDTASLVFTYLGYRSEVVKLSPALVEANLRIGMERRSSPLPGVEVVSATNELVRVGKNSASLSIDPDQIGLMPGKGEADLLHTMSTLPGISASDEISPGIRIRGDKSDENLVLLDGYTVYHIDHFFGAYSAFNPPAIKTVRLLKGPFDAAYGGRAGGVLALKSKQGNIHKPSVELGLTPIAANTVVEVPVIKNNASLMVSGRRSITDVVTTPTYRRLFSTVYNTSIPNANLTADELFSSATHPDFSFYDLQARFSFAPTPTDDITLSYYQDADKLSIDLEQPNLEPAFSTSDKSSWGNSGGSVRWSKKWNKHYYSKLNIGLSSYTSDLDAVESRFFETADFTVRSLYLQDTQVEDVTVRFDNQYKFNSNSEGHFGAHFTHYNVSNFARDQDIVLIDNSSAATLASLYYQHAFSFNNRWDFSPGLRVSHYNQWDLLFWQPRLTLNYQATSALSFKAAFGVAYQPLRRPAEQRLYLNSPEIWLLSGPESLPLLRTGELTAGAEYRLQNWAFLVDGFQKRSSGTIDPQVPEVYSNEFNLKTMLMNGHRKNNGVEVFVKRKGGKFSGWASYTFMHSQTVYDHFNSGNEFPSYQVAKHEFKLNGLYRWKRFNLSATFVIASGHPYTPLPENPESLEVPAPAINSANLPVYHRLDAALTYKVKLHDADLQLGLSVYNLYDHDNTKFIHYVPTPGPDGAVSQFQENRVPGLGLVPSLSGKITF